MTVVKCNIFAGFSFRNNEYEPVVSFDRTTVEIWLDLDDQDSFLQLSHMDTEKNCFDETQYCGGIKELRRRMTAVDDIETVVAKAES
ncbi:hypothetical protein [Roseobacter sp.]|uniref:hypothetical protein n=1 Tax=Roseobacter sp. TaxID=1907202 RepID=UPI003858D737